MVQDFIEPEEVKTTSRLVMEGKLANPPEYKHTTRTGNPTCKLTIKLKCEGLNELNREPAYWNWHSFGDLAIACSELQKGEWLSIVGRLGANRWFGEDKQTKLSIHGLIFRIGVRPAPKSKEIKWLGHQKDGEPPTEPEVEVAAPNGPSAVEAFIAH